MHSLSIYARECLFQSFQNVIVQYEGDTKTTVINQLARISQLSLYNLFTKRHLDSFRDEIFTVSKIRDFMLAMTTNFFYRFGDDESTYLGLINLLTNAVLLVDAKDVKDTLVPEVIAQRLPNKDDVGGALEANKWLIVVLLINLNLSVREIGRLHSTAGTVPPAP